MTVPGRLFLVSAVVVASIVSPFATQQAYAQQWLSWRHFPITYEDDSTGDRPAVVPATKSTPLQIVVPTKVPGHFNVVANATLISSVLAPAQTNSPVSIERLPSDDPAQFEVANISNGSETAAITEALIAPACDEISRCGRLEVVRSGVGVEAPKDDATKRRPENAAKRHVLQSVRSVW